MKFVLVINLNDDVVEDYEDFTVDYDLRGTPKEDRTVNESIKYIEDAEPRPLPQFMEEAIPYQVSEDVVDAYQDPYATGWNDCLRKITGETE